ncbi:MAG TPA: hypothetical protein VFN03_09840, partial [Trueperaceae bacterium]|nr:hypothetical protein [Trueperaceae bacterium]
RELDALKKDLAALRGDMTSLTETSARAVKDTAAGAAQAAKEAAVAAKDKLMEEAEALYERMRSGAAEVAGTVKEKGTEAVGSLEHTIEAKPLTSVLTALGIGFAVGWLATRK